MYVHVYLCIHTHTQNTEHIELTIERSVRFALKCLRTYSVRTDTLHSCRECERERGKERREAKHTQKNKIKLTHFIYHAVVYIDYFQYYYTTTTSKKKKNKRKNHTSISLIFQQIFFMFVYSLLSIGCDLRLVILSFARFNCTTP